MKFVSPASSCFYDLQAFVRLSLGTQEIFFVATPNSEKQYSFELDVAESVKEFGQLSGSYSLVCTSALDEHVCTCLSLRV